MIYLLLNEQLVTSTELHVSVNIGITKKLPKKGA
jgi:hypothetical protein